MPGRYELALGMVTRMSATLNHKGDAIYMWYVRVVHYFNEGHFYLATLSD